MNNLREDLADAMEAGKLSEELKAYDQAAKYYAHKFYAPEHSGKHYSNFFAVAEGYNIALDVLNFYRRIKH